MQLGPWTAMPVRSMIAISSAFRRVPSSVPRSMKPSQNSTIEGAPIASASRTTCIAPATGTEMTTRVRNFGERGERRIAVAALERGHSWD